MSQQSARVLHDYVYRVYRSDVFKGMPCERKCTYLYKTRIEQSEFTPRCATCGAKMNFEVLSRQLSENQYNFDDKE